MKKKTLTTVALGAVTLAAGMAGNVHADSVKVTKQQIGDETKITTTTTKDVNQQKIAQDKQNISSQQTVVSSAKSSLDKAKANASSASQVVSSAQSKVNDAKKVLDAAKASQPDQIKHQVATDQSQVNTDKQNISSTQSSITTDKSNVAKDQQAINNVGQKAQQDQNKLNNDQSKLSSAQSTLNNDQKKLTDVNNQLKNVESKLNNYPSLGSLPDSLKNAINNCKDPSSFSESEKWINSVSRDGKVGNENDTADNYKIDPLNLTYDQKVEMNRYALQLVNSFRTQMGLAPAKTNKNMIDLAEAIADAYSNKNIDGSHSQEILSDPAIRTKYGVETGWSNLLENIGFTGGIESLTTMKDLKNAIATKVVQMVAEDGGTNHWGHAYGFEDASYLGVAVDKFGSIHFIPINDGYARKGLPNDQDQIGPSFSEISDPSKFKDDISVPNVSELQNEEKRLQNQASQLQDQVNKDKQVVNDLQNQVNADKAQLQKDTPAGLQQQLQNDQKKLADDQATLQKQQQKLAQDEAQLKADQNKLNSITPEDIANAQKALDQAQTNYNNAVKALNEAQSKANVSNDELAKAQQNYINALNKLNELKQILENDEKQITTTSIQWIKNQHPSTTSSMGNKVVLHSSSKTSAVSSEKEANTVHADTVSAVKLAQTGVVHFTPVSSKKAAKKNTLPQMGDENSNKTVWGEISLAMAGVLATLGLADRKRRN